MIKVSGVYSRNLNNINIIRIFAAQTTVLHINPHEAAASQVTSEQLKEVERLQKAFQ